MKKSLLLSTLLLGSIVISQAQESPTVAPKVSVQDMYIRSLTAIKEGQVQKAEQYLRAILNAQPNHPQARYQLAQLMTNRAAIAARARQLPMEKIIIDEVDYSDASLSECLASLTAMIQEKTNKTFTPNFVVKDPNDQLKDQRITLKLSKIPASQLLKYINDNSHSKAKYEEHAIVISPVAP